MINDDCYKFLKLDNVGATGVWHLSNYAILIEPIFYMVFILSSFYHFYVVICYDVWYNYIVGCD